eukprot:GHVT01097199.1.p1 GENE.GHVT01097199.1~~GHVT01097199.1.p1  ORF type:complete len:507 (+),score=62.78 GHVT01097199.1:328-1848(+)
MAEAKDSSAISVERKNNRVEVSPSFSSSKGRGGRSAKKDEVGASGKRNRKNKRVALVALVIPGLLLTATFACVGLAMVGKRVMDSRRRARSKIWHAAGQPPPDGRMASQAPGGGSASFYGQDGKGDVAVPSHSPKRAPSMIIPHTAPSTPVFYHHHGSGKGTFRQPVSPPVDEGKLEQPVPPPVDKGNLEPLVPDLEDEDKLESTVPDPEDEDNLELPPPTEEDIKRAGVFRLLSYGPYSCLDYWSNHSPNWRPPPRENDRTMATPVPLAPMNGPTVENELGLQWCETVEKHHGPWVARLFHNDFAKDVDKWLEDNVQSAPTHADGACLMHALSEQMVGNQDRHVELQKKVERVLKLPGVQLPDGVEEPNDTIETWNQFNNASKANDYKKFPEFLTALTVEHISRSFDGIFIHRAENCRNEVRMGLGCEHRYRDGYFPITGQTPVYVIYSRGAHYSTVNLKGVAPNKRMTVADFIENVEQMRQGKSNVAIKASHTVSNKSAFNHVE